MHGFLNMVLVLLAAASTTAPESPLADEAVTVLEARFDRLLADPDAYARMVNEECTPFPEGDLFPYTLPALAYANLAIAAPERSARSRRNMEILIKLAAPAVRKRLKPRDGDLSRVTSYGRNATYLCQFNLVLGAYRLAGGDDRHEPVREALTKATRKALQAAEGKPMHSFPGYTWTFDTIPCLLTLAVDDHLAARERGSEARTHLSWLARNATDSGTDLPNSRVDPKSFAPTDVPRGCELSWRVSLMALMAPEEARTLYRTYVDGFWRERLIFAGFAEWPEGVKRKEDMDSGPIIMGIGMAASALGLSAARSTGDAYRFLRLSAQMSKTREGLEELINNNPDVNVLLCGMFPVKKKYYTGFLFGDAVLFYALSWTDWKLTGGR